MVWSCWLVVIVALAGCELDPKCSFTERCDGTRIERCGVVCTGDKLVDCKAETTSTPCPTGNTCEVIDANKAVCFDPNAPACDGTEPACLGDAMVDCILGKKTFTTCPTARTCFLQAPRLPACVDKPVTSCDPTMYPVCSDTTHQRGCVGTSPGPYAEVTFECMGGCVPGTGTGGVPGTCK